MVTIDDAANQGSSGGEGPAPSAASGVGQAKKRHGSRVGNALFITTELVQLKRWGERAKKKNTALEDELALIDIWLFHPNENIRILWDILMMIVMIFFLISIPYTICFEVAVRVTHWWSVMNLLLDLLLFVDIVFTFNTALIVHEELITDRRRIARSYLHGWFWVDLATCLPLNTLISMLDTANQGVSALPKILRFTKGTRFIRVLRILKVMKVVKLFKILSVYHRMNAWRETNEKHMNAVEQLLKFLLVMFLTSHVAACALMGITMLYREGGDATDHLNTFSWHPDSWIASWDVQSRSEAYLLTLYWAFTTLTTVGYGDITANLQLEILWFIVVMIVGTSMFGFIIGAMASVMSYQDQTQVLIEQKMESVDAYMKYRAFPPALRHRIHRHYNNSWRRDQVYDENEILKELPPTLRTEAALYVHRDIIEKVPFLKSLSEDAIPLLVTKLVPMYASSRDIIIKEDYFGAEMYFVLSGNLKIYFNGEMINVQYTERQRASMRHVVTQKLIEATTSNERLMEVWYKALHAGDYFSDYCLLLDQAKHPASVKALQACELFSLSKAGFQEVVDQFPEVYRRMMEDGINRYRELMEGVQRLGKWATAAYLKGMKLALIEGEDVEEGEQANLRCFTLENPLGFAERWARREEIRRRIEERDTARHSRVQKIKHERLVGEGKLPASTLHNKIRAMTGLVTPSNKEEQEAAKKSILKGSGKLSNKGEPKGWGRLPHMEESEKNNGNPRKSPARVHHDRPPPQTEAEASPAPIAGSRQRLLPGPPSPEGLQTGSKSARLQKMLSRQGSMLSAKHLPTFGRRGSADHKQSSRSIQEEEDKEGQGTSYTVDPWASTRKLGVHGGISISVLHKLKNWKRRAQLNVALNNMRAKQEMHQKNVKQRYRLRQSLSVALTPTHGTTPRRRASRAAALAAARAAAAAAGGGGGAGPSSSSPPPPSRFAPAPPASKLAEVEARLGGLETLVRQVVDGQQALLQALTARYVDAEANKEQNTINGLVTPTSKHDDSISRRATQTGILDKTPEDAGQVPPMPEINAQGSSSKILISSASNSNNQNCLQNINDKREAWVSSKSPVSQIQQNLATPNPGAIHSKDENTNSRSRHSSVNDSSVESATFIKNSQFVYHA